MGSWVEEVADNGPREYKS